MPLTPVAPHPRPTPPGRRWGYGALAVLAAGLTLTLVPLMSGPAAAGPSGVGPSNAASSNAGGGPITTTVLLVGDSTALTFGIGLDDPPIVARYHMVIHDEGLLGCGVAEGPTLQVQGKTAITAYPCNPAVAHPPRPAADEPAISNLQWMAQWKIMLKEWHPNVVVLLAGRWEVVNRVYQGQLTNILNPTFAAYVKSQLQKAVTLGTSTGAHMVLMTTPCYDSGTQPNGQPWPEDQPVRVQKYNSLVRQVAAANPSKVSVVDLYHLVCPDGKYTATIHGVTVRSPDGVHFTIPGGEYLAPKILPAFVRAGQRH